MWWCDQQTRDSDKDWHPGHGAMTELPWVHLMASKNGAARRSRTLQGARIVGRPRPSAKLGRANRDCAVASLAMGGGFRVFPPKQAQ